MTNFCNRLTSSSCPDGCPGPCRESSIISIGLDDDNSIPGDTKCRNGDICKFEVNWKEAESCIVFATTRSSGDMTLNFDFHTLPSQHFADFWVGSAPDDWKYCFPEKELKERENIGPTIWGRLQATPHRAVVQVTASTTSYLTTT